MEKVYSTRSMVYDHDKIQALTSALDSAGTMPWAARDLMQWPVATPGEGVIDLVIQSIVRHHLPPLSPHPRLFN